jgi:hypothetical protein
MNLAQLFIAGYDYDENNQRIVGDESAVEYTFQYLTCGHIGNCPCDAKQVTVTPDIITFSDGSIYYTGIGEGAVSDEHERSTVFEAYEQDYHNRSW